MKKNIATAPLKIGRARALNAGAVVPDEHLERFGPPRSEEHPEGEGWNDLVETIDVDDAAAAGRYRSTSELIADTEPAPEAALIAAGDSGWQITPAPDVGASVTLDTGAQL